MEAYVRKPVKANLNKKILLRLIEIMTVFKRKILRLIAMIFMHLNTKELLPMFFVLSGKAWVYGLWADIVRSVIITLGQCNKMIFFSSL